MLRGRFCIYYSYVVVLLHLPLLFAGILSRFVLTELTLRRMDIFWSHVTIITDVECYSIPALLLQNRTY